MQICDILDTFNLIRAKSTISFMHFNIIKTHFGIVFLLMTKHKLSKTPSIILYSWETVGMEELAKLFELKSPGYKAQLQIYTKKNCFS